MTITREQAALLPKARLIGFRWCWPFNGRLILRTRGANFAAIWLGPLQVSWRMPWIERSAKQLYPHLWRDDT